MQRSMGSILLMVIALALTLGIGLAVSQQHDEPESEDVPEVEVPLVIPDKEKNRKNPYQGNARSAANGKMLFQSQCTIAMVPAGTARAIWWTAWGSRYRTSPTLPCKSDAPTASCTISSATATARCRVRVRASPPSGAGIWWITSAPCANLAEAPVFPECEEDAG